MRSPAHPVRVRGRSGFASILLANLIPLIGVVQFGWAPAALVVIYAIEVLLSILLAGVEALFARRHPPEERDGVLNVSNAELTAKRGSVEVVAWLPPIYPRNVPFAAIVIGGRSSRRHRAGGRPTGGTLVVDARRPPAPVFRGRSWSRLGASVPRRR